MMYLLEHRLHFSDSLLAQNLLDRMNWARQHPQEAMQLVNIGDLNEGLPAGSISPEPKRILYRHYRLDAAAAGWAHRMMTEGFISHEKNGSTPAIRVSESGYLATVILENAGLTISSVIYWNPAQVLESQFRQYLSHAGHRIQLMDPRVSNVGIAVETGLFNGSPAMISVQDLAKPVIRMMQPRPVFPPIELPKRKEGWFHLLLAA